MFKNYFKIAWRNIMKHKVFSFINVIGLTIGLSASFVIGLMIYYEYTFDNFHEDGNRIYRVVTDFSNPEGIDYNSGVTLALKDAILDNPNFESIGELYNLGAYKVENKANGLEFKRPRFVTYTDSEYFNVFEYNFLAGNKKTALSNPNTVVLTEARAEKYFPKLEPSQIIGKTLVYNDSITIKVTGIVENFKQHTDIIFEEFISNPTLLQTERRREFLTKNWNRTNSDSQLYVKLKPSTDLETVQNLFDALALEHRDEYEVKFQEFRQFKLQPLRDIHFNEDYGIYDRSSRQASKSLLRNLALVAIFLLLLGCINFINLNTAQATQRAKEIGIRKTLGSSRKQLISQFMGETLLLVLLSAFLSLLLSKWLINIFSDFVPEDLSFELFKAPIVSIGVVALLVVVTFLSGFYPAMILSKLNTVSVLKNHLVAGNKKVKLRKFLTVFQFTIAQVFIIATLLVGKQINYLLNKDMGFKTEAIVSTYNPRWENEFSKKEIYAKKLRAIPEIKNISLGGPTPASTSTYSGNATYTEGNKKIQSELELIFGDTNYFNLFELELLAGRIYRNDTIKEIVINEAYSKVLGFNNSEEAIGKTIIFDDEELFPIVGVMADFHQRSLRSNIKPMALSGDWYRSEFTQFDTMHIAFQNESSMDLKGTLLKIEKAYKSVYSETDNYSVSFLDETIERFYNREQKISKLLNWATGLSILISCLGLLGLVIYTTNRRVKEIGVRKVLGASLLQLNTLLCKEFLILVAIAFVIATPVAWYGVYSWLQDFVYKADISFFVFLVGGCTMIFFALLVISIKTLQAANANPVNSLRSE